MTSPESEKLPSFITGVISPPLLLSVLNTVTVFINLSSRFYADVVVISFKSLSEAHRAKLIDLETGTFTEKLTGNHFR